MECTYVMLNEYLCHPNPPLAEKDLASGERAKHVPIASGLDSSYVF